MSIINNHTTIVINKMKPILIMGLPGSGKTALAKQIAEKLGAVHWNADDVRNNINKDLKFSTEDRIEQAKRMGWLANTVTKVGIHCVVDFVCPLPECRDAFGDAFVVWVDRIASGRFEDTNKLFIPPTSYQVKIPFGMSLIEEQDLVLQEFHKNSQ